ncbi:MAG: FkbM family methyltransferase [Rhodospirillales bacterium]|nr:FkbM family methyltransferase [Rhodospirillales bacterium]MBO6786851.1 FkbM family methyltransferase [Rhodospirillales bacterium]
MVAETLIAPALPAHPFSTADLPPIAKLARAAHHRYRKRWTKRLGKKPVRFVYDLAQDVLKLGGRGRVTLAAPNGERTGTFDARHPHFGSIYFGHDAAGYEPDVSTLLSSLLTDSRTFFDIGANWGYFSFYAASLPGFEGPIHSFEPAPVTRADLTGLIEDFGLAERITVHGVALSDAEGSAVMAIHDKETGLNRIAGSGFGREGAGRVEVPLHRLDDLNVKPDVIKMDVEDHEFEALSGAREMLAGQKPFIIVESWLTYEKPIRTLRALRLLEDAGYVLFQPAWQVEADEGTVILPDIGGRMPGNGCRLAIVPFASEQRFMLSQQMNVFACHADRLDDLKSGGFAVTGA